MTNHVSWSERRRDAARRLRVSEMSIGEMQRELLTSEVTGLPNRRAFDEAGPPLAVAMSDLDGLKALNRYGYAVGNAILKAKACALVKAGLEAYHDKGDEFLCRGLHVADLSARLERARAILRAQAIFVSKVDGTRLRIRGADFSYGVGKSLDEAESSLGKHKAEREKRGEVARGELRGIRVKTQEAAPPFVAGYCSGAAAVRQSSL